MTQKTSSSLAWAPYAAAAWAGVFAVFHLIWAAGWYPGLDDEDAAQAFARPWTLPYDLVVAGMCVIAVVVALALERRWGERVSRRQLRAILATGTVLLLLRAVASIVQLAYLVLWRGSLPRPFSFWEPWFWLGATLFSITTWRYFRMPNAL